MPERRIDYKTKKAFGGAEVRAIPKPKRKAEDEDRRKKLNALRDEERDLLELRSARIKELFVRSQSSPCSKRTVKDELKRVREQIKKLEFKPMPIEELVKKGEERLAIEDKRRELSRLQSKIRFGKRLKPSERERLTELRRLFTSSLRKRSESRHR